MNNHNSDNSKTKFIQGRVAVYPGTFDPVTLGHLDIAARALHLCDTLVIAVGDNRNKSPLFTVEERITLLRFACPDGP